VTPRLRRWLTGGAAAILLLFLGRWLVGFLAIRWWAAAISPDALASVTRWALLGLALDIAAVLMASIWFAAQALLVARSIGSVQVEHQIGDLRVREAIPTRLLLAGAVAIGALLGLVTGVGAREWRAPLALAWQGVRYGINDPFLGRDLGVLTANYPVWHLAQRYAALLVILGIVLSGLLYMGVGALRRVDSRWDLHLDARRHLGGLLGVLGLVIAVGYLLAPLRLATAAFAPTGDSSATVRILAANAAAGAAIAVAAMSFAWAVRARHSLLVAGWTVFALAALAERVAVPAFLAEGPSRAPPDAPARQMEAVFWGLRIEESAIAPSDTTPSSSLALWDERALSRWTVARGDGTPLLAVPTVIGDSAVWLVASRHGGDETAARMEVTGVAAGRLDAIGQPVIHELPSGAFAAVSPRTLPGRGGWLLTEQGGVPAGGWPRRLALAWALQQPGIIPLTGANTIDWALDPIERLQRLVPPIDWTLTGLVEEQGRLSWLLSGLATVERAPQVARREWRGRMVSGVVPALVGLVDVLDGSVRLYGDPAADALGLAWGHIFGPLVAPAEAIPAAVGARLGYPRDWLEAQLEVLEGPIWPYGTRPGHLSAAGPPRPATPVWTAAGPAHQTMFEDPARGAPLTLITAQRRGGMPSMAVQLLRGEERLGARSLQGLWERTPALTRLRDSVRAASDTLLAGPIRWRLDGDRLLAWQVWWSAGREGNPALLWIGTADGTRPGGGRRPESLWADSSAAGSGMDADLVTRIEAARGWMRRADSALARGDLTAFGRAWEALRGLFAGPTPE
jgi:hypothetical protein